MLPSPYLVSDCILEVNQSAEKYRENGYNPNAHFQYLQLLPSFRPILKYDFEIRSVLGITIGNIPHMDACQNMIFRHGSPYTILDVAWPPYHQDDWSPTSTRVLLNLR